MLSRPNFYFPGFTFASYEQINPHLPNSRTKTKEVRAHAKSQLAASYGAGMWKRKRLIFCGSGSRSTLMKEVGSGSELESIKLQEELEVEALKF